jgi:hypothetical protein
MLRCPLYGGDIKPYDEGLKSKTIIYPRVYRLFETKTSLSVLFTRLPMDWVETSVQVPIIQVYNKIGLPAGFTLESSFQSIVVANLFRMGPHYTCDLGKFSISAGCDATLLYGKMQISGFDNEAIGWGTYPAISIGYSIKDLAFTLSGEFHTIRSLKISSGDAEISNSKNFQSGQSLSLFMEQRLWKNHIMILGFTNNFQKFYFPAWPAFSAFNRRYYIPQFQIGLVL